MNFSTFFSFWKQTLEERKHAKLLILCIILALLQGGIFVGTQLLFTGTLSSPLDDTFIHLQYAKQIAQGNYFQYQDGEPITSGETSFLYAHLLALGYLIGFQGIGLLFWSYLLAGICLTGTFYLLIQLGLQIGYPLAGWGTAALLFCSGCLGWAYWSGMEIALYTFLLLYAFTLLFQETIPYGRLWIAFGLLTLCRPEGLILTITILSSLIGFSILYPNVLPLVVQTSGLHKKSADQRSAPQFLRSLPIFRLSFLFYLLAIIGPPLFFHYTIGRISSNSLLAKSLLYNPIMTSFEKGMEFLSNFGSILLFFLGHPSVDPMISEYMLPGTLLFFLVGIAAMLTSPSKHNKSRALVVALSLTAIFLAVSTLEVWPLHNYRYLLPYFPIVIFFGIVGVQKLFHFIKIQDPKPTLSVIIIAVLLHSTYFPAWTGRYMKNATTIYEKQIQTSQWLNQQLPKDRPVAINDAGALAYFGDQTIYDLVGLVTNDTTIAYRMGEGGLYERLEHLPQDKRPAYAAVFPSWFNESAITYDIFHKPLVSFPDPFDNTFTKTVYRINWSYAGMEDSPRQSTMKEGWRVKDRLDVADILSEKKHRYQYRYRGNRSPTIPVPFRRNFGYHEEIDEKWPGIENEQEELIPILRQQGILNQYDIVDSGRRINGEEQFQLGNLTPQKEAFLIIRTCYGLENYYEFSYRMGIFVNDIYLGEWNINGTSWNWYESVFTIPDEMVQEESVRIRIKNLGTSRFPFYTSFYYWICQKETTG